jgi:hypothetical protein
MREGLKATAVEKVGQSNRVSETRHYRIEQNRTELFCWYSIKSSAPCSVRSTFSNQEEQFHLIVDIEPKNTQFAFVRTENLKREMKVEMGKGN